jgi:hypothetical protein
VVCQSPSRPTPSSLSTLALCTFIGAVCTTISSIVYVPFSRYTALPSNQPSNLTVLMALNGEAGWVCLMCCNSNSMSLLVYASSPPNPSQPSSPPPSSNGTPPKTTPAPSPRATPQTPTRRRTDISFPHDRAPDRSHLSLRKPSAGGNPPFNVFDYATSDKRFASAHTNKYSDSIVEHGIRRTSSQKRVLDMGDIAVDGSALSSTSRASDQAAYKASSDGASSPSLNAQANLQFLRTYETGALQSRAAPSGGVVVTTTINPEPRPETMYSGTTAFARPGGVPKPKAPARQVPLLRLDLDLGAEQI